MSRAPYAGSVSCTPSEERPESETNANNSAAIMAQVCNSYLGVECVSRLYGADDLRM